MNQDCDVRGSSEKEKKVKGDVKKRDVGDVDGDGDQSDDQDYVPSEQSEKQDDNEKQLKQRYITSTGSKRDKDRQQKVEKQKLKGKMQGIDNLLQKIDDSNRQQSSTVKKSKLDWQIYTQENKLTSQLQKNRKSGGEIDKFLFQAKRK